MEQSVEYSNPQPASNGFNFKKWLIIGGLIVAGYYIYKRNFLNTMPKASKYSNFYTEYDIDTIRINLHEFIKTLYPNVKDDDIRKKVISMTTINKKNYVKH